MTMKRTSLIFLVSSAVTTSAIKVPAEYQVCMMDGSAQPTFSFAKFCAQFSQSWKVPVQVNPMRIMAIDSKEK